MSTITRTRRTVAQIAADIDLAEITLRKPLVAIDVDLSETHTEHDALLDALMADDAVLVDVWSDDESTVVFLGHDAAVTTHGDVDTVLDTVARKLRMGWGREGDLPEGVEVERHDGRTPLEADVTARTAFRPHVAGRTASWRLIEDTLGTRASA